MRHWCSPCDRGMQYVYEPKPSELSKRLTSGVAALCVTRREEGLPAPTPGGKADACHTCILDGQGAQGCGARRGAKQPLLHTESRSLQTLMHQLGGTPHTPISHTPVITAHQQFHGVFLVLRLEFSTRPRVNVLRLYALVSPTHLSCITRPTRLAFSQSSWGGDDG